jgi:hypothetical protein
MKANEITVSVTPVTSEINDKYYTF